MHAHCVAQVGVIINDRVDVALAVGAHGVHVGQDDMPAGTARQLLGGGKVLGVSVKTVQQAQQAAADGADYLGAGASKSCFDPRQGGWGVGEGRGAARERGGGAELHISTSIGAGVFKCRHDSLAKQAGLMFGGGGLLIRALYVKTSQPVLPCPAAVAALLRNSMHRCTESWCIPLRIPTAHVSGQGCNIDTVSLLL